MTNTLHQEVVRAKSGCSTMTGRLRSESGIISFNKLEFAAIYKGAPK